MQNAKFSAVKWHSLPLVAEWQRTDAKPRAEGACTLCRGAKEEDHRSMAFARYTH